LKRIPKFASEAEDAEFWGTLPDIFEYFDLDSARVYGSATSDMLEELAAANADDDTTGPVTRGVVVLHPRLAHLASYLRDRNMIVVTPPTFECVDVLIGRILIVRDEEPLVQDASSFCYGLVSTLRLARCASTCLPMAISEALATRALWTKRHGFLLRLRDNGEHEYRPLVD
jgi:hypothetical protein